MGLVLERVTKFRLLSRMFLCCPVILSFFLFAIAQDDAKAREVVKKAIKAMGGRIYLQVQNSHSQGWYYTFDKRGRTRNFSRFQDWTVYEPIKWRFQLGKDEKRREVTIYNLEIEKGWTLEGKTHAEEISSDGVQRFIRVAAQDMDVIFRKRLDEEGMNLYYYGPQDVAGSGEYEAVEFLDTTNSSIVVFFDLKTLIYLYFRL